MTSNFVSPHLTEGLDDTGAINESMHQLVMDEMRRHFRPKVLNRVDDIMVSKSLSLSEMEEIVVPTFGQLRAWLLERRINPEVSAAVLSHVARQDFDPIYCARPLRRYIKQILETQIGPRYDNQSIYWELMVYSSRLLKSPFKTVW